MWLGLVLSFEIGVRGRIGIGIRVGIGVRGRADIGF